MKGKIYRLDDVERMLPLVSQIATDLVAAYGEVNRALHAYQAEESATQADPRREAQLQAANHAVEASLDHLQGLVDEIEALGGNVRDYENASVDFYGERDGEIVYLCWQLGDERVTHWHGLDEGFAKRKPLAQAAAA
ncbi:MAG: DUF2203 domain-containing protein [Planctomycetia bacterium]